jgi:hypothetical protein
VIIVAQQTKTTIEQVPLFTSSVTLPCRKCGTDEDFKSEATRIIPSFGAEDGWFNLHFEFVDLNSVVTGYTEDHLLQVWAS